jgi:drug/metabolite transporter (DMT)-like permease
MPPPPAPPHARLPSNPPEPPEPPEPPAPPAPRAPDLRAGFFWGAIGVVVFALTLPMTRLAVGDTAAPQLPPDFVTAGRAALAGLLSMCFLLAVRARRPAPSHWPALGVCALGTVLGFPLGIALALREVPSMHAAVVTGLIPLATAACGAVALRQRPSAGFWACALAGFALVLAFAWRQGGGGLSAADGWLAMAVVSTGIGYVAGARVAAERPASEVICWVLVISLPVTVPWALLAWPVAPAAPSAWAGFAYVTVFSMWLGFFAWYRGLALGGVVRVSQVQLLQPFVALIAAVPILGEPLAAETLVFALAVAATVFFGRRMPVTQPLPSPPADAAGAPSRILSR